MAQQIECVVIAKISQLARSNSLGNRGAITNTDSNNQFCSALGSEKQGAKNRLKNRCYLCLGERTKEFRGLFICLLGLTFAVLSAAEEYTRNWRPVIHILAASYCTKELGIRMGFNER